MRPDELIAQLRDLADRRPNELRDRIAALSAEEAAGALIAFVMADASWRASDALADPQRELPPGDPAALADTLDYAKSLSDAIDGIDSLDGLMAAAFDGLSAAEAHLCAFERGARALIERRSGER